MKITIYGAGYVGLVTGACLADAGNEVLLVDVNEWKTFRRPDFNRIKKSMKAPLIFDGRNLYLSLIHI